MKKFLTDSAIYIHGFCDAMLIAYAGLMTGLVFIVADKRHKEEEAEAEESD